MKAPAGTIYTLKRVCGTFYDDDAFTLSLAAREIIEL